MIPTSRKNVLYLKLICFILLQFTLTFCGLLYFLMRDDWVKPGQDSTEVSV